MRHWPTFVLALVLGGLGAYLYFVELPGKESQERTETENKRLLVLDQNEITGLTIKTDDREIVMVKDAEKGWNITAPVQSEADRRAVENLLRALVTGKVMRVIEDAASALAPFGLDHPITVVTVSTGTKQDTFSIGDSGPLSSTLYVFRESDRKVLLTDLAPKDFVNKSLLTFRRKDIFRFSQSEVERVRLTYPATEIVLYHVDEKPKSKWKIRYPIEAGADQIEVRTLLLRLEDLKALALIDPGPERDSLAKTLTAPKIKVTLHTSHGDQTVKLYQPDPSRGEAIAETSPEAPLYRISPTAIRDLTKDLFSLQDKRLLGVETAEIALLSVKTRTEQYVLINQNGEWVMEDHPTEKLDQQTADLFVSRVANVPAEERVTKQTGPLAAYGLVAPAAEFVATGKDGKVAGKLSIGNQSGGLAYAMGQRLQGIFQIRADLLSQVPPKNDLLAKAADKGPAGH
jgi:Domain of unknown function (DUF4340)